MKTLFILLIFLVIIIYTIFKRNKNLEEKEKEKSFTELSIKFLIIVFFSIIASIIISLEKEIPASSGHGAFVYIIIPGMVGILVFFVYIISLTIEPKRKILFGIISVMLNLAVGIVCSMTEF